MRIKAMVATRKVINSPLIAQSSLMSVNTRARKKKNCKCLHIIYKRLVHHIRLTIPGKYSIERAIWIAVHLLAVAVFSFMIYDTTRAYRSTPSATHMATDMYPINQVDFPAVVICNINLISKREAKGFVEELWRRESVRSMNLTKSRILELVKYVGHLYTFSIDEETPGDIDLFHTIMMTGFNKTFYDVHRLTREIGVPCNRYVIRCQWEGVVRTCADIIEPRYTPDGNCCTFNYARRRDHFTSDADNNFPAPIEKIEIPGSDFGLWLLLDVEEDDYFYQLLPFVGFKVVIYTPTDYPDASSGGTRECLVAKGTETLLNIGASVFATAEDFIRVDQDRRDCLFKSEFDDKFGGQYSFSDCIMFCRVQDIVEKCKCIPFFYPIPNVLGHVRRCNFADLICLNHYQNRWWGMAPILDNNGSPHPPGAFSEIPEGHLHCQCYPTCTNTDYTLFKTSGNIKDRIIIWERDDNGLNRTGDHTVLNVYFGGSTVMQLQHDVQYYWYELMSNYGGLCNIFLGLSLTSGIELIYKFARSLFGRRNKIKSVSTKVVQAKKIVTFSNDDIVKQSPRIHWQEINAGNLNSNVKHNSQQ